MTTLVELASVEQYNTSVANKLVCIHFTAAWCHPCIEMNKICEQLAAKNSSITFYTCDAEKLSDITEKFDISAVPAFVILKVNTMTNLFI